MPGRIRSVARRSVLGAAALTLVSSVAVAQRATPAVRQAGTLVTASLAADSVAHYTEVARVQRRTGGSFVAAGLTAVAAAYVTYARAGRMGMNGGQGAAFVAGAGLGAFGISRWTSARTSEARADEWRGALEHRGASHERRATAAIVGGAGR